MASTDYGVRRGVEGMGTRDGIGSEKPPDARKKNDENQTTSGRAPRSRSVASRRTIVDHTHTSSRMPREHLKNAPPSLGSLSFLSRELRFD